MTREQEYQAFNRRVMENRARLGCYNEDGLIQIQYGHASNGVLFATFVDDTQAVIEPDRMYYIVQPAFLRPQGPTMAEKWLAEIRKR